jgi:hypothetical protein
MFLVERGMHRAAFRVCSLGLDQGLLQPLELPVAHAMRRREIFEPS